MEDANNHATIILIMPIHVEQIINTLHDYLTGQLKERICTRTFLNIRRLLYYRDLFNRVTSLLSDEKTNSL